MADYLIRILTQDGKVRLSVAVTTLLVRELQRLQHTDPTASVALGRIATAAALLGSLIKGNQRVALSIEGNGPLKRLQAESDAQGHIRATVRNPIANLPPQKGRFDVPGAVGHAGFLHVIKDLGMKEPYRGMVQLVSSEIAEDLAYYFTASEQTPSSVALGVELDQNIHVAVAGGFLLQLMPEAGDEVAMTLTTHLQNLPPCTSMLRQGLLPEGIAERILEGRPYHIIEKTPLSFVCSCSYDQAAQLLKALGVEELDELLKTRADANVTCEYCKQSYNINFEVIQQIRASF